MKWNWAPYCYYDMFPYCTSLTSVRLGYKGTSYDAPEQAFGGESPGDSEVYGWVNEVPEEGWLYYSGSDSNPVQDFKFMKTWQLGPY